MIVDSIENFSNYCAVHPAFPAAFAALQKLTAATAPGRIEVDGDRIFINLAAYTTKPHAGLRFENHARYIDIQYVLDGCERIDATPAANLPVLEDRLAQDDIAFYADAPASTLCLTPGRFVVLFPGEAHKPCMAMDEEAPVVKAVVKILY